MNIYYADKAAKDIKADNIDFDVEQDAKQFNSRSFKRHNAGLYRYLQRLYHQIFTKSYGYREQRQRIPTTIQLAYAFPDKQYSSPHQLKTNPQQHSNRVALFNAAYERYLYTQFPDLNFFW